MADAYQCDWCEEFEEGDPHVSLDLGITVERETGLLSSIVENGANPSATLDFCSLQCLQAYPLNAERDELLTETNAKDQLLDGGDA